MLAANFAGFFGAAIVVLGQLCAIACRREERTHACTGGTQALGQVALRYQFEFELAAAVELIKHIRIGLAWKAAHDLAHAPCFEQCGQTGVAVARVVVDDGQIARALGDQAINEFIRNTRSAKATDEDGGSVLNARHGLGN